MKKHFGLLALFFVCGLANANTVEQRTRSTVYGTKGAAATSHPLATQTALDVLKRGGTAIDAAIAANAVLAVVEPSMCGLGGDAFAIVWSAKDKQLYGLNGSGRAPKKLTADKVEADSKGNIPMASVYGWTVPGAVDAWFELHERFGNTAMAELLKPAVLAAKNGVPVAPIIAEDWNWQGWIDAIKTKPGFKDTFLIEGELPKVGQIFKNSELAKTLELIAGPNGREIFYRGVVAEKIVEFSKKNGGFFELEDFSTHRSEWVEPISVEFMGATVWELPPNGQGLAALQIFNMLKAFGLEKIRKMGHNSADYIHLITEVKRLVYEDMAKYYADPKFSEIPIKSLLSMEYAQKRIQLIDMKKAATEVNPGNVRLELGDTTYLTVADQYGNMVSLIESNYFPFGSGYTVMGFPIQNRGALFSLKKGHANELKPGKRPFHTIIPGFVTKNGQPWISWGVMGGSMQPQGHVQTLLNLLMWEKSPQQAGDEPRFKHYGSTSPKGSPAMGTGFVTLENGIAPSVRQELISRGHQMTDANTAKIVKYTGGYQIVRKNLENGVFEAGSDRRKDGNAGAINWTERDLE